MTVDCSAMCADRHRPVDVVWPGKRREPAEPGADENDRRAVHGDTVLWRLTNDSSSAQLGLLYLAQACPTPDGEDGTAQQPRTTVHPTRNNVNSRACCVTWRSIGPIRSGMPTSPTSRCYTLSQSRRNHGLGDAPGHVREIV